MGALYLASKLEECPIRIRDLINVYDLLLGRAHHTLLHEYSSSKSSDITPFKYTPMQYFAPEFYEAKEAIVVAEMQILKRLGFNVRVQLPYGTMVNYLQVLGLANDREVPQTSWDYLNDAYVLCFRPYGMGRYPLFMEYYSTWQIANAGVCTLPIPHPCLRQYLALNTYARDLTSGRVE